MSQKVHMMICKQMVDMQGRQKVFMTSQVKIKIYLASAEKILCK